MWLTPEKLHLIVRAEQLAARCTRRRGKVLAVGFVGPMWVNTVLQGSAATYYIHGFNIHYLGFRQTVPSLGARHEGRLAAARHALLKHRCDFWCGLSDATNAIKRIQIGVQDAVQSSNTVNHFPECIAKRTLLQGRQAIGTLSRIVMVK